MLALASVTMRIAGLYSIARLQTYNFIKPGTK